MENVPNPWHRFYDEDVPRSIDYPRRRLHDLLVPTVRDHPERTALIFENARLTFRELDDAIDRLATALARLGVRHGTRVAIQLPNLPQTVIAFFATLRLGGVVVMTNPLYMPPEIEQQWNDAGVEVAILLDAAYRAKVEGLRDRIPVKHYIVASIPEYLRFPLNLLAPFKLRRTRPPLIAAVAETEDVHRFRALIRRTPAAPPEVAVEPDDVAMLQYTGGTTGVSKGATLTHRIVSANVEQLFAWMSQSDADRNVGVCCLPLFHIYGITVSMLATFRMGGALVLIADPRNIGAIVRAIEKHRATVCPMVPAQFTAFNLYPGIERRDLSSLRICNSGSAPLPVEVGQRFESLTGARITEGYGLSETSPVTHSNPIRGTRKTGSIGVPLPDTDARIADPDDPAIERSVGEKGELLLRGPQVFSGYWNRPDENATAFWNGWFRTGDLARCDADGFYYIVGRKKDMILASGFNVYPDEIDRVLVGHDAILEAATIGIPDPKRGETIKSFVVLKPGRSLGEAEIVAYCRERLAAYKVPRSVEFRESLPRSTAMKILRRQLREEDQGSELR